MPTIPQGTKPANTRLIDGAKVQTTNTGFNYNGESDLDLQYAIALGTTYFRCVCLQKSLTVYI
jgi:hypothetical protein